MGSELYFRFSGQKEAMRFRDGYLDNFDNQTKQSVDINLEMTIVPMLLGICFLVGMYVYVFN